MHQLKPQTRRHFTAAARAAAAAKRLERAMMPRNPATPELFVVRCPMPSLLFGWEIRRFGGVVLAASEVGYGTIQDARLAGEAELAAARAA